MKELFVVLLLTLLPPTPQGAKVGSALVVPQPPEPYKSLVRIVVQQYTPQVSMLKFYYTNRVFRYSLERSEDLVNWIKIEGYNGTNDYTHKIPMLRDEQNLVAFLLVAPQIKKQFYRVTILP